MSDPIADDQHARSVVEHDFGRTLFVEAGAGTGKTTALVKRIVGLVLDDDRRRRVRLSEIAAITFTEAAAAELRDKIRIQFERAQLDAQRSGDLRQSTLCAEALADADIAAISTLHAFAHRLLSEHPVEVGLPPNVEVIDEVRSQIAFDRRWSDFVDELFADPDVEQFIVRASILNAGLGSRGAQLRHVASDFDQNWDRLVDLDFSTPLAAPIDWRPLEAAIAAVQDAGDLCLSDDDKLLGHLDDARPAQQRFLDSDDDNERLRLLSILKTAKKGQGRKANWSGRIDDVKELVEAVTNMAEHTESTVANQTLDLLSRRIARFTLDAAEERRREGELEFHDLLVLARQLLRDSADARAALSARYRVLMLDEFQDTDPIQIELAMLLAAGVDGRFEDTWKDLTPEPGRLFMVGDPKQSIYRFRRADITLFLEARARFGDGLVELSKNYRTVRPIIDFVNALFAEVMPETNEAEAAYSPLVATRDPSANDHRPMVFGGLGEGLAGELRDAEAADVADIVTDIRDHPKSWAVFDRDTDSWRDPELRDITILLPTRTSLSHLTDALDGADIPYRADTGTLVYESQEVRDLLAVMKAIDDPTNQIALVAALKSPLYACGDDDLWQWKRGRGEFDLGAHIPEELADNPVASAIEHLRGVAERRWWDEPSRLLLRVIDDRRAFVVALGERRARDTWRRLRYVVDQARAFEESSGGDLRDYLAWTALQGLDGSRAHEPMLPEADDDAVQIMTIHGAKGLEFPITIVSGLTTKTDSRSNSGARVLWGSAGSLPEVKIRKGIQTDMFEAKNDLDEFMDGPEKNRLLYVALTRACDHLVVSAHHGTSGNSHGKRIHEFATRSGDALVRRPSSQGELSFPVTAASTGDQHGGTDLGHPDRWAAERSAVLAAASRTSVRSATALARTGSTEDLPIDDESALPPRQFRRGRAGTAIGSAVHGVLQLVDLADPTSADLDLLVEAQAWAESVPEHTDVIVRSVRSALAAPIVRSCQNSRHWKELYVAAPVEGITLEGYVDLLVEQPGGLVVVDYKTDSVRTDSEIHEKLTSYSLQAAAYAVAVETATALTVLDAQIVFTLPDGPLVRSIVDLDDLKRQVSSLAAIP